MLLILLSNFSLYKVIGNNIISELKMYVSTNTAVFYSDLPVERTGLSSGSDFLIYRDYKQSNALSANHGNWVIREKSNLLVFAI